jgi:acetyl esterase/lipase
MARDIAAAVSWVKENIAGYGGDPGTVYLMGHSAGAHLVALVGTNEAYLEGAGFRLADLSGVIPLDTGPYNVEAQLEATGASKYGQMLRMVFSEDPENWTAASPWHHVASGKEIPPFLVFYHQGRRDAPRQAIPFVERLQAAGVEADVVEAEGKNHGTLNRDLGASGDGPTEQSLSFMKKHGGAGRD